MSTFFRSFSISLPILAAAAIATSLQLAGCSGKDINEDDPANLYNEAEEDIKSDHYQIALDKLRIVKNKHPYSKQAVDAQLRIADVYFMQESYAEAASSYEAFRDLHPKHARVAYAMFRLGLSWFNDIPGNLARDLTPANKALESFEDFVKRFPNAAETPEATAKIADTRRVLAEKELYIANFYFKRDEYPAAKSRFSKIIAIYPDTPAAEQAKQKLARIESEAKKE